MGQSNPLKIDPGVLSDLQAGQASALGACYRVFGGRIYRLCRSMLGQAQDAEDATQEVFLKLFRRASQFKGKASFSTWLHRIAVNHCLQRIEKERLRRAQDLDEGLTAPEPSPLEASANSEHKERIDQLLERLPPAQRAVVVLREVEGLSYTEIAEALEIPEGTVMSRLARGRERLAAQLIHTDKERASRCAS